MGLAKKRARKRGKTVSAVPGWPLMLALVSFLVVAGVGGWMGSTGHDEQKARDEGRIKIIEATAPVDRVVEVEIASSEGTSPEVAVRAGESVRFVVVVPQAGCTELELRGSFLGVSDGTTGAKASPMRVKTNVVADRKVSLGIAFKSDGKIGLACVGDRAQGG